MATVYVNATVLTRRTAFPNDYNQVNLTAATISDN
jgi:hypothetical protein